MNEISRPSTQELNQNRQQNNRYTKISLTGRLFSFFSLLVIALFTQAQLSERDSLVTLIEIDSFQYDSTRLKAIQRLATISHDPEEIIFYSRQLIESGTEKNRIVGYFYLGYSSRLQGDLTNALAYLDSAANLSNENNSYSIGSIYQEMATCFSSSGDIDNGIQYNLLALKTQPGYPTNGNILINLAYDYYDLAQYDSALRYYDLADSIFSEKQADFERAYIIGNRALVKWKLNQIDSAIIDLKKAIEMLAPLKDEYGMADYYNQLGTIYYEQGNLENAAKNLSIGVEKAMGEGLKEQIRDASRLLSEIYAKQEKNDSAYLYLYQYVSMRDSIANEEIIQQLANQRANYEIGLKQAEIDLANQQKRNRLILAIAMSVITLLTAILLVNFYLAYQKRKRLYTKLQELDATKDKFFSIISHDLRGPISAFNGISSIIKSYLRKKSYDQLEEMTDLIDKSSNSLSGLLDNLLNWSVQQQGQIPYHPEPLELHQVIRENLDVFESISIAKGVQIETEIKENLVINADKNTTLTIFRNLLGNAIKYTNTGGKISITASEISDMVVVKIKDTGLGMTQEMIDRLFEVNAKKSTYGTNGEKGLGLGLLLVQEFVLLNQGHISVESVVQVGSTFTVSLPVAGPINQDPLLRPTQPQNQMKHE